MRGWYDRRVLPELIGCACRSRAITRQRARLVPEADGEVLELGIGGGANLRFYDPGRVHTVQGVDPSPELRAKAETAPRPDGLRVRVEAGRAENLPFEDGRFDTAVATFTLCSVADPGRALKEVRRVLKPRGRLLFCEHGLAPERRIARWQHRLEPVWSAMAGGCRLTRDMPTEIGAAGYRFERLEQRYLRKAPKLAGWVSSGVARPV